MFLSQKHQKATNSSKTLPYSQYASFRTISLYTLWPLNTPSNNRTLLRRRIALHLRVRKHLPLMMPQRRIRNGTHGARLLLLQHRVGRRQVGIHRPDDGASRVGDGLGLGGALESRARGGVHGFFVGSWDGRVRGVVVDDVAAVVGDFGVCDGAAGFGV